MKVVIDVLWARIGGGLSFITQQVAALERVRPEWKLEILGAPWNSGALRDHLRTQVKTVPLRSLAGRLAYEQAVLPTIGCDILYAPGNFCPLLPTRAPIVLTVHNPSYYGEARWAPYNRTLRRQTEAMLNHLSMRRADAITVVSDALMAQIDGEETVRAKCAVIKCGAPELPGRSRPPEGLDDRTPFFLSIHNDYPHKRLADAVGAWAVAFGQDRYPPRLVMVGDVSPEARARYRHLVPGSPRSRLVFLGQVRDRAHVRWLYEHALASISTSELETFGMTLLEAGAVGCPLMVTDLAAHLEVAGDRARFVPVGGLKELAASMVEMRDDPPPRDPWHWPVSWDDSASQLATVMERIA